MRIKILIASAAAGLCLLSSSYGQDKNIPKEYYLAATIPDSLKADADAVIRYEMKEITVKAPGRENLKYHSIVTVLSEKGDSESSLTLNYNKYKTCSSFQMRIYNAAGMLVKKYGKSDMYDRSASDEGTLSDERLLHIEHSIGTYPATVEISYEEDIRSFFVNLGGWYLQPNPKVSVQNSVCRVNISPAVGFRYKAKNTRIAPEKTTTGDLDSYTWQAKNIKAFNPEDNVLDWQLEQSVLFAANNFEFYGIPGNIETWQGFGAWYDKLNADVCTLSPQRVAEIVKMTDTIKSDKDKASFLYKYLQQSTRYVSIQFGIGGFRPFPATFVDQKKYGDCKALANYMKALLKAVNIPSYYAIINAGDNEEPADIDFPNNSFNHLILCVPFKNDTTWLDCTMNNNPYGKLGTFTENRKALIVTETGGKLVNTPKSTIADNTFESYAHVTLNPDGSAKAQLKLLSSGEYRSMYLKMQAQKIDDQKEFMIRYLNMKQPIEFKFNDAPDKKGVKEVDVDLVYDRFFDLSVGDKQFYKPGVFDLWRMTLPETEKRKMDFYFEHPMQKSCVTTIDLPAGFEMETLPANVKLKFSYGDYEASYQYNKEKNQVISTVKFNLTNFVIPAAKYTEMQQYFEDIAKAQNKKLVIKRKA